MQCLIEDVHPPLYYLLLKPILDLTGESMFLSRLLSAIAGIIILWAGALFIDNHFGKWAASFFVCFIFLNPFMIQKSGEIRMYMLASAFTVMSGIMSYHVLKDTKRKNWLLFVFFSLLAAYTHYYALLTMIFLYSGLLAYFIFTRDRKKIMMWVLYSSITVIVYLPWIPIAWSQVMSVNQNYWITIPGSKLGPLRELFSYYKTPYTEHVYVAVLILLTVVTLIRFLLTRNLKSYWILMCCSALWGTMVFSIWYASKYRPILVSRYLIIPLCLLILGISCTASYLNKYLIMALCMFCILAGGIYYKNFFVGQINPNTTKIVAFSNEHKKDNDCILYFHNNDDGYFANCMLYYFPQTYCIAIEEEQIPSLQDMISEPYKHVWFFDQYHYLDNYPEYKTDFKIEDWGNYGFGNMEFEIYKIEF